MQRPTIALSLLLCAARLLAAEKVFDFSEAALNEPPPGFRSVLAGTGLPGDWKIILDEAPTALPPLSPKAPIVSKRRVVAQLSRDRTDERFPMLVFDEETFGDFTLTTRFKIMDGVEEQMAGLAFRIQDEKNYYYIRASAKGNTFYFYKVVNGIRNPPVGEKLAIARDVWHEMTIECKGNQIRAWLNGKEVFPALGDKTFASGKIGFWTKSDSVAYFADTRIAYTQRESFAQVLVRDAYKKYPRLEGLRIFASARSNA